jgi:glutaredoxin-related protein
VRRPPLLRLPSGRGVSRRSSAERRSAPERRSSPAYGLGAASLRFFELARVIVAHLAGAATAGQIFCKDDNDRSHGDIGGGMTTRNILDPARIHPAALEALSRYTDTIGEIEAAIAKHAVVVVGMAQNPHVKNVRRLLREAGVEHEYLEYGSYFSEWRRRLAIKQWSGWPTFPQVFVRGTLIGGEDLTKEALANGALRSKLEAAAATA